MCLLFICEQPWNEFSTDLGHLHVLLEESVHTCPWQSSGSTQLVNGHPTVLIQQSLHLIPMLEASAWASWAFLVCAWGLQSPCLKSVEPLSHLGASKGVPAKHFLKRSPYLNNWFATSLQELDRGPLLQASGKRSHCHESKKQKKHCRQHGALAALNADASQCCVNANLAVCTQQGHAHSANIAWHAGNMSVFDREKSHKKPTIWSFGKQRKTGQEWNSPRNYCWAKFVSWAGSRPASRKDSCVHEDVCLHGSQFPSHPENKLESFNEVLSWQVAVIVAFKFHAKQVFLRHVVPVSWMLLSGRGRWVIVPLQVLTPLPGETSARSQIPDHQGCCSKLLGWVSTKTNPKTKRAGHPWRLSAKTGIWTWPMTFLWVAAAFKVERSPTLQGQVPLGRNRQAVWRSRAFCLANRTAAIVSNYLPGVSQGPLHLRALLLCQMCCTHCIKCPFFFIVVFCYKCFPENNS